jgi:recombination protein RecA
MNSTKRGILYGMAIGDGSVHNKKDGNCTIQFTHSVAQKDYAEFKAKKLNSILGGKQNGVNWYKSKTPYGEVEYGKYGKSHKYCNQMRRVLYPYGKKTYTRQMLDYLNPEGLAYWYMDDGGLSKSFRKNKDTGEITGCSCEMRISTYCSLEEIETIILYFKEVWDIEAKKRLSKKHGTYYLAFNSKNSKKFELLIKPYILESMFYKLPSNWITRAPDILRDEDIV